MRLLLGLVFLLSGCALRIATNGPATVVMGPADRIRMICTELTRQPSRGCLVWQWTAFTLYCGYNDVECLAHEIRHAVEPQWRHD